MFSVGGLVLCLCGFVISAKFPPTFPKCFWPTKEAEAQEFNDCFATAAEKAKPFMRKGIAALGVPGLTKFVIPSITVEQKGRALEFICTLSNVSVEGLDGYQVSNVRMSPTEKSLKSSINLPRVEMKGEYDIVGRVLGEGVKQKGPFTAEINDIVIDVIVRGTIESREGTEYGNLTNLEVHPAIGSAKGNFRNLFGENRVLNRASEAFLDDSTNLIIDALKPDFFDLAQKLIHRISASISAKIPLQEIFPRRPASIL